MIKDERTCPRCGLVFSSERLDGLCPACLISATLDGEESISDSPFWDEENDDTKPPARAFSHFELLEEIGRGGMGVVYRARDFNTGRIVALKVLQAHHLEVPDLVQRFRSEVRAVTSLDHPHVLPVHEVGEYEGIPFFSMKLTTGGSLGQRLGDYLSEPKKAAELLAKIARGVHHAHERGILHRDLKPANILIDAAGEPYVADFGLAKWLEDDRRLTVTAAVLGTPHYIAPEQAHGEKALTIAVDVYSLGAILYELLTGRPPFVGQTVMETLRQASENTPDRPSSLAQNVPRDLETICLKCLEREPASRYPTAAALADDLENWLAGRSIHARPVNAAGQLWRWAKRNPLPAALGTLLFIMLVVIAIGSTIAAIKVSEERTRAVAAEKDAKEQLYQSRIAQAQSSIRTGRAGQRFDALEALKQAAHIHPTVEVRNEVIAALALLDLRIETTWTVRARGQVPPSFDEKLEYVVAEGKPGYIRVVRIRDQTLVAEFEDKGEPIEFITHSGIDLIAVRHSGGTIRIWNMRTQIKLFELSGRPRGAKLPWLALDCAFSPNQKLFAAPLPEKGVAIYDATSGIEILTLPFIPSPNAVVFSPTGDEIAITSPGAPSITIWDVSLNRLSREIRLPAVAQNVAWSPDGQSIAVGCIDFNIYLFTISDGQPAAIFSGHRQEVTQILFNHAGDLLASTSRDKSIRIWSLHSLAQEAMLSGFGGEPSLRFSFDDNHLAANTFDTQASLLLLGGTDRVCTTMVSNAGSARATLVGSLDFSPDGKKLATASYERVDIWNPNSGAHILSLFADSNEEKSVMFASNQDLIVGSRGSGVKKYNLTNLPSSIEAGTILLSERGFIFSNGSQNHRYLPLTSSSDGISKIYDLQSQTYTFSLGGHPRVGDMAVNPDLSLAVLSFFKVDSVNEGNAQIWSVSSRTCLKTLTTGPAGTARFSADGKWLVTTGVSGSAIWSTADWKKVLEFPDIGNLAVVSPDNALVAISDNEQIDLVSLPDLKVVARLRPPLFSSFSHRLSFSDDGAKLAAQGADNSVRIWNIAEIRKELSELGINW